VEADVRALLILSIACLALGLGLIFYFCNGSTSFSFGYPLTATRLHIDITTTGVPALLGLILAPIGSVLLAVAWIIALVRPLGRSELTKPPDSVRRRNEPFTE
jgi:TRAP-type C4-dicarboxylate transport system permease small subunit